MTYPGPVDLAVDEIGKARVAGGRPLPLEHHRLMGRRHDAARCKGVSGNGFHRIHSHVVFLDSPYIWSVYYRTDATGTWVEDSITPRRRTTAHLPTGARRRLGGQGLRRLRSEWRARLPDVQDRRVVDPDIHPVGGLSQPYIVVDAAARSTSHTTVLNSNPGPTTPPMHRELVTTLLRDLRHQAPSPSGPRKSIRSPGTLGREPRRLSHHQPNRPVGHELVGPFFGPRRFGRRGSRGLANCLHILSGISFVSETTTPAVASLGIDSIALEVLRDADSIRVGFAPPTDRVGHLAAPDRAGRGEPLAGRRCPGSWPPSGG